MAYFGITATEAGLRAAARGEDLAAGLRRLLRRRRGRADRRPDPRLQVPSRPARRRSAPLALLAAARRRRLEDSGAGRRGSASPRTRGETGLCVGFAWPASAPHLASLARHRAHRIRPGLRPRRRLRRPARRAGGAVAAAGAGPADRRARPFARRAGGARRAAAPRAAPGRMILLGAAEFDARGTRVPRASRARGRRRSTTSPRGPTTSTTPMFETFAPRRGWGERAIGAGSGRDAAAWLDLQLDRADVTAWINAQGIPLTPPTRGSATGASTPARARSRSTRRSCGGSPAGTSPACAPPPASRAQEPRWSRLIPRRRPALPDSIDPRRRSERRLIRAGRAI